MCAALVTILVLLNVMFGGYLILFIPIPLMYYGRKASVQYTLTAYITSVFLTFIVSGFGYALLVLGYGAVGLTYIFLKNAKKSKLTTFMGSTIVNIINFLVMLFTFSNIIGVDINEDLIMISELFGLQRGPLLTAVFMGAYLLITVLETWVIIYVFEAFEVLIKRIEK